MSHEEHKIVYVSRNKKNQVDFKSAIQEEDSDLFDSQESFSNSHNQQILMQGKKQKSEKESIEEI